MSRIKRKHCLVTTKTTTGRISKLYKVIFFSPKIGLIFTFLEASSVSIPEHIWFGFCIGWLQLFWKSEKKENSSLSIEFVCVMTSKQITLSKGNRIAVTPLSSWLISWHLDQQHSYDYWEILCHQGVSLGSASTAELRRTLQSTDFT